jgi:hypothetical protein
MKVMGQKSISQELVWYKLFYQKKIVFIKTNSSYSLLVPFFLNVFYLFQKFVYLSFNVTTASTIVRMVTTQNLTAILLS